MTVHVVTSSAEIFERRTDAIKATQPYFMDGSLLKVKKCTLDQTTELVWRRAIVCEGLAQAPCPATARAQARKDLYFRLHAERSIDSVHPRSVTDSCVV